MSLFIQCGIPCVIVGPRSSGKTATARHYLRTRLNRATHQVIIVNTSKSMDAKTAQKILMGQMERRRKSVYGPTVTLFYFIHFVFFNSFKM
jgi:predicted AAA+ superfamily ATPase